MPLGCFYHNGKLMIVQQFLTPFKCVFTTIGTILGFGVGCMSSVFASEELFSGYRSLYRIPYYDYSHDYGWIDHDYETEEVRSIPGLLAVETFLSICISKS